MAEGEGRERCEFCPIRDENYCPELDPLSKSALVFGRLFDHPAHAGYSDHLFPLIAPRLRPSEIVPWLDRRAAAWEAIEGIRNRKRQEAEEDSRRRARPHEEA